MEKTVDYWIQTSFLLLPFPQLLIPAQKNKTETTTNHTKKATDSQVLYVKRRAQKKPVLGETQGPSRPLMELSEDWDTGSSLPWGPAKGGDADFSRES